MIIYIKNESPSDSNLPNARHGVRTACFILYDGYWRILLVLFIKVIIFRFYTRKVFIELKHEEFLACLPHDVMLFFGMGRAGGRVWVGLVTDIWCPWENF